VRGLGHRDELLGGDHLGAAALVQEDGDLTIVATARTAGSMRSVDELDRRGGARTAPPPRARTTGPATHVDPDLRRFAWREDR
jgi:hypothetical protein